MKSTPTFYKVGVLLFKFYYNHFRAVKQTERKCAVSNAAADHNCCIIQLFDSRRIWGKYPLIRYKHTIVGKWHSELTTVSMTSQSQIHTAVTIGMYKFRSMAKQHFKTAVPFCKAEQSVSEDASHLFGMLIICNKSWVCHTYDSDGTIPFFQSNFPVFNYIYTLAGYCISQAVCSRHPGFVVSTHIINRGDFHQSVYKRQASINISMSAVKTSPR